MKNRGAFMQGLNKMIVKEIEMPSAGHGQVVVKMEYVGIFTRGADGVNPDWRRNFAKKLQIYQRKLKKRNIIYSLVEI